MEFALFEILGRLGFAMIIGSVLMALSAAAGWTVARFRGLLPVRMVAWWLSHIVLPLLSTRKWLMRTLVIFTNNTLVLALLVALGTSHVAGRIGVILAGLSLGIALFLFSERLTDTQFGSPPETRRAQRLVSIGVVLNLLEIVAIILALGLAVGAAELGLARAGVWKVFGLFVVPALIVAAGGEALWIGVVRTSTPVDRISRNLKAIDDADKPPDDHPGS